MNEDKIITMLLDHEDGLGRIENNMATKEDLGEMSDTLDKILKLIQKTDQEVTMISHGMKRHENKIEKIEKDIIEIRPLVGLI